MRDLFLMLIGLIFPACAGHGTQRLPPAQFLDVAHIVRPSTPNTALAAPAGFKPPPDIVTPRYGLPPAELYRLIRTTALAQPRTFLHAEFADRMQIHFVARSRIMNFPDLVTAQVQPDSTLILWSRSVYGHSDLGVNRARLTAWLAAVDAALPPATRRGG